MCLYDAFCYRCLCTAKKEALLTISIDKTFEGLVPRGNFHCVRHVVEVMIHGHKHIFGIAHNINVSRLVIIKALRYQAIGKVSFEYTRLREAVKHVHGGLCISHGVRKRFYIQNKPF